MALPTLALGNIGSGTGARRAQRQTGQESAAGPQPQASPGAPQTFAQMSAAGQARPAPPMADTYPPPGAGPSSPPPMAPPPQQGVQDNLSSAVNKALTSPSPYNTDTFNALRDSATNDLSAQYGKIRDTTNTDLARRGLSASTERGNAYDSIDAAQSRDLSDLNAKLLGDAATTQGTYESQAIGAGQNYVNAMNQTGLSQQQQDLAKLLGVGNLNLSTQAQANQVNQFGQTLAQNEADAKRTDTTANRQVDASFNQSQQDFLYKLLASMGISSDALKGLTGGTSTQTPGGSTGTTGQGTPTVPGTPSGPDGPPAVNPSGPGPIQSQSVPKSRTPPTTIQPTVSAASPRDTSAASSVPDQLQNIFGPAAPTPYDPAKKQPYNTSAPVESQNPAVNGMSASDYLKGINTPGSDLFKQYGDATGNDPSQAYYWNGTGWALKQQSNGFTFDPSTNRYVRPSA